MRYLSPKTELSDQFRKELLNMADIKKKIAACSAAAAMTLSLAGCTDTSYVMTYDGNKIPAGVYIYNMYSEMSYQMTMMYYTQGITEKYFDQEVDGKKFADYLSDRAMTATKEYCAIVSEFEELGLELTDDELSDINDTVRDLWENSSELLEKEGISRDSVKLVNKASKMRDKIFDYYYAEGGIEEVKDSDIEQYLNENYVRYKTITIAKSTNEDESAAAEEDKEKETLRDEYLAKAEGVSFDEFDEIINEYNDYVASQNSTADDSSSADSNTDSAASDDSSSSVSSDDSQASNESSVDSAADSSAAGTESETDSSAVDSSADADSSSADSESTSGTTSEDPYKNEVLYNVGQIDEDAEETDSIKLAKEANGLEVGVAEAYEDDNNYYVVIKGDITERSAEYATENHDSMVQTMKSDDFQTLIDGWVEKLKISENKDAIKRYTPTAVYDIQTEYTSKSK